jgi:NTE family protein
MARPKIGLVLGSGAARGWAHIGVIRELAKMGIKPDLVVGSSVGAVVGGAYASGHLDEFEAWISTLGRVDIIKLLDFRMTGGGFLQGKPLMDAIEKRIGNPNIADLVVPFACVATSLGKGREHWLREGPLLDAVRASIAVPGLFAPALLDNSYMVDGGLVDPVPISLARAMGADFVIAVNLNGDIMEKHSSTYRSLPSVDKQEDNNDREEPAVDNSSILQRAAKLKADFGIRIESYISTLRKNKTPVPGLFDVMVGSINIMQDRITRSRMAGDPPDVHITPKLSHIGLMEFDRSAESMSEGRQATRREKYALEVVLR